MAATVPNYILVASGSMSCPTMDIAIYDDDNDAAFEHSQRLARAMAGSQFYKFNLYCMVGQHRQIARLGVDQQPVVHAKRMGE